MYSLPVISFLICLLVKKYVLGSFVHPDSYKILLPFSFDIQSNIDCAKRCANKLIGNDDQAAEQFCTENPCSEECGDESVRMDKVYCNEDLVEYDKYFTGEIKCKGSDKSVFEIVDEQCGEKKGPSNEGSRNDSKRAEIKKNINLVTDRVSDHNKMTDETKYDKNPHLTRPEGSDTHGKGNGADNSEQEKTAYEEKSHEEIGKTKSVSGNAGEANSHEVKMEKTETINEESNPGPPPEFSKHEPAIRRRGNGIQMKLRRIKNQVGDMMGPPPNVEEMMVQPNFPGGMEAGNELGQDLSKLLPKQFGAIIDKHSVTGGPYGKRNGFDYDVTRFDQASMQPLVVPQGPDGGAYHVSRSPPRNEYEQFDVCQPEKAKCPLKAISKNCPNLDALTDKLVEALTPALKKDGEVEKCLPKLKDTQEEIQETIEDERENEEEENEKSSSEIPQMPPLSFLIIVSLARFV